MLVGSEMGIRDSGCPTEALIVATRLSDLSRIVYSSRHEPDLIDPLMGSCFFPLLYGRPVRVRTDWLLDGGAVDNLPIEILAERGATDIIAVISKADGRVNKTPVSYTHLRAHETVLDLVCRLLLEKKKTMKSTGDRQLL